MTHEDMTYEVILQRMMDRVTDKYPDLDNREGSILFNALAPAALELAIMYTELDNAIGESFIDTASREYLFIGCEQIGMDTSLFEASYGVHKGVFDVQVPIDSRWNCDLYNYTVTEYIGLENGKHAYRMNCDTEGTAPNNQTGDLTPITDMPDGLEFAQVVECLIEGENETSDEDIRKAYHEFVNSTGGDGNVIQYQRWCEAYPGVGNAKIFPLWNGANTVKVSILSASNGVASSELVTEFQKYLDPNKSGMGDGVAPIGAKVTVTTATELSVNVSATVSLQAGYSTTDHITTAVKNYLSEIAYKKNQVPYMNIGAAILSAEGVESVSDLKVNNGTADLTLADEQIPVLGTATWTVS